MPYLTSHSVCLALACAMFSTFAQASAIHPLIQRVYQSADPYQSTDPSINQSADPSINQPTEELQSRSGLPDNITAAIAICSVLGLLIIIYFVYKLVERRAPIWLAAISPSHRESLGFEFDAKNGKLTKKGLSEVQMKAITQATSRRGSFGNDKDQSINEKDSHAVDIPELSINEQWTVRGEVESQD